MDIHLFIVSYDSGVHGVRMGAGPRAIVDGGLKEALVRAGHRVGLTNIRADDAEVPSEISTAASYLSTLSREVSTAVGRGELPIVLAGSCYSSVGTVAGMGSPGPGVVWFDSHGDLNTPETSGSGFIDGMAASILTGRCWGGLSRTIPGFEPLPDESLLMLGLRDLDPSEVEVIGGSAITSLTVAEVNTDVEGAAARLADSEAIYIHLDLDVIDPAEARANQLAAPDGFRRTDLMRILNALGTRYRIGAIGLTAYDPRCDPEAKIVDVAIGAVEALIG